MKNHQHGVVYVVTSQKTDIYIKAAIKSARSCIKHCPDIPIHIFTDKEGVELISGLQNSPFSSFELINNPHYRSKVDCMPKAPFEHTLYLDSDTMVVDDISEMFGLLDRFDIAVAHAHKRNFHLTAEFWRRNIPPSFPQFNSGVVLYKNSPQVSSFLRNWRDSFHAAGIKKDQVTLRELLWLSDLRIATLPPEYNIRYQKYIRIWNAAEARPKILHMAKFHKSKIQSLLELKNRLLSKFL
jgi:hypothetical protein